MSLDHNPDRPSDWDDSKVYLGKLVVPDDLSDEDIPPGIVVPYEPRTPVLRKTGSAAMVVVSKTGRYVDLSARGVGVWGRWFGVGMRSATYLGRRYVRSHDYQEAVGGLTGKSDWNQNEELRRARWKFLGKSALTTLGLNLAGWWALVKYGETAALDWSWMVPPAATGGAATTAITWHGRYRANNPGLAPEQILAEQDDPDSDEPFPLAMAQGERQVADCVSRALAHQGIGTRSVEVVAFRGWGWELDVTLANSKPADVSKALDDLDAILDIPAGGTMFEPDPRRSARIAMRLVQSDPFASMERPAIHAPQSLSVHDRIVMGRAMDGVPFELTLDGFCALIVGGMGAGKTLGAARTLAEALTACVDAVCWDLDPLKGGLAEFGDLMEVRARTTVECEEALARALTYVSARAKVMVAEKMGDRWKASAKHPHLFIFVDEFLQMSTLGKRDAISLLRTGRQYGIYVIFMGQEATEDALGDAVASIFPYKIGMACRFEDVRIMFGPGKSGLGWRPDRLEPAVGEIINDAGQSFIMGGAFNRAIRYRFNGFTRDQIIDALPARIEAGVNRMDADTLIEAGVVLATGAHRASLADRVEAFADQTGKEDARTLANLLFLYEAEEASFLPTATIVTSGIVADGAELQGLLAGLVPGASSRRSSEVEGRPRGWDRTVVEQAGRALFIPT